MSYMYLNHTSRGCFYVSKQPVSISSMDMKVLDGANFVPITVPTISCLVYHQIQKHFSLRPTPPYALDHKHVF